MVSFTALESHIKTLEITDAVIQESKAAKKLESQEQEGKKRKATVQGSKGVEKLKKANIKGMAKISSFFQKSAAPNA